MFAAIWGSPMVIDGKVYLGDEDGDVTVLTADRTMKVIAENNMGSSVYSTAGAGQRRDVHRQSQPAVRDRGVGDNERQELIRRRSRAFTSSEPSRSHVVRKLAYAQSAHAVSDLCRSRLLRGIAAAQNWPAFRGPTPAAVDGRRRVRRCRGTSPASRNVAWKTPIPGLAHSSPIVWGDRDLRHHRRGGSGAPAVKTGDVEQVGHRLGHRHWSATPGG